MKSVRLMISIALLSLATAAVAQSNEHQHAQQTGAQNTQPQPEKRPAPKTEAQKFFEFLKTFAGEWEGPVTVSPALPEFPGAKKMHVTMRVLSRGNTIAHEFQEAGTPLDPTKYDHPLTMIYLNDAQQLNLVHYCDAGNRPHMQGKVSPDGKTVEFDLVDLSGGKKYGHMHRAVFTYIDDNHHIQEWTYVLPGEKPIRARFDLKRVQLAQK